MKPFQCKAHYFSNRFSYETDVRVASKPKSVTPATPIYEKHIICSSFVSSGSETGHHDRERWHKIFSYTG